MPKRVVDRQVVHQGKRLRLEIHHLEDENGQRMLREVGILNGAVVILPFLDAEQILLIRNRRYTIGSYLMELPAGGLDAGAARGVSGGAR